MTALRRDMIGGGLAMLALAGAANAEDGPKTPETRRPAADTTPRAEALDTPALHGNTLAGTFRQPPAGLVVPRVKVERASGVGELKLQPGLTLLSLWAPWCGPCLRELKDFAEQQGAYAGKRFRILPVLTEPRREIALGEAQAVLNKAGAKGVEAVIDRSPRSRVLFEKLARRETPNGYSYNLPCNLLVDADGRVLARQFGSPLKIEGVKLAPGEKPTPEMVASARTLWLSADGQALLGALQRGEIAAAAPRRFVG